MMQCCKKNCIDNILDEKRLAFEHEIDSLSEIEKIQMVIGLVRGIRFRFTERSRFQYYICELGFMCRKSFLHVIKVSSPRFDQIIHCMDAPPEDIGACRAGLRAMAVEYEAELPNTELLMTKQHFKALRRAYVTPDGRRLGAVAFLRLANGAGIRYE